MTLGFASSRETPPARHQGAGAPRPAWLREAIAAGRALERFAVGAAAPAAVAPIPASPAKKTIK
jgi:hypothetical protein